MQLQIREDGPGHVNFERFINAIVQSETVEISLPWHQAPDAGLGVTVSEFTF